MANIRVDVDYTLIDGQPLTFKAPCGFGAVDGLIIYYPNGETTTSKVFTFRDTHGNTLHGTNLFVADTYVKVLLDTVNNYAYPQNADTNAYLEGRFDEKATLTNGVFATQVSANSSGQAHNVSLLRNSRLVDVDTYPTVNGEINWTYV